MKRPREENRNKKCKCHQQYTRDGRKKIDASVKEDVKSEKKKNPDTNMQENCNTMKSAKIRIIRMEEGKESQLQGLKNYFLQIIEEFFFSLKERDVY